MQSVQIHCPIPVKALMTFELREELMATEQAVAEEVERQLATLHTFAAAQDQRDIFEMQRRLLTQQAEVETRLARLAEAPEGEPFVLRVVQGLVTINPGDNFLEKMSTEIFLENGVVTGIHPQVLALHPYEVEAEAELEPVA